MTRAGIVLALVLACGLTAVFGQQAVRPAVSRRATIAAIEDARAPTAADVRALAQIAAGSDARLASAATRALGRLERRDLVSGLIPLLSSSFDMVHDEAANALAQSFRGAPLASVSSTAQLQTALDALAAARKSEAVYRAIGRLPYETVDQVRAAEAALTAALNVPMVPVGPLRGLESLARLQRRLAPLDETTLALVRDVATGAKRTQSGDVRRNALAVLVAAQGADEATIESALQDADEEVRRLAVLLLGGAGSAVAGERRTGLIRSALGDTSPMVRFEAVRAWARRGAADEGCAPLLDALSDASTHVALAAIDALGDQCRDDDTVADRLTALARTPPSTGDWQREAHALVALSKRAPDRAAIALLTFAMHPTWQVRMYAARAAAQLDDVATLQRLAADADDTVVETVLPALRKRAGAESDQAFVSALNRRTRTVQSSVLRPYQVFREAAIGLKGAQSTPAIVEALLGALQRTTAEQCETSRDARLAIIERITELGSAAQVTALTPLLSDIDLRVAGAAADAIAKWTGRRPAVAARIRAGVAASELDFSRRQVVEVELANGRSFHLGFFDDQAPLSKARFLELVEKKYYDGLTFHRVVPNFVVQGGSPNANEYCGDCPFMRDEVGLEMHVRGTLGISTRGRDTGDAQIFVNLVDNPRLDHEYTVFAYVCRGGMSVVDALAEGERVTRMRLAPIRRCDR